MQTFLEILWAIIFALTGAALFGIAIVGGVSAILGCATFGCFYAVSRRRKRRAGEREKVRPD